MAIGFALVYGVSRLPNFAHGAFYVLTGFVCWSFIHDLGLAYWLSAILAVIITTLIGVFLYQFCLIRVRGREVSEIILSFAVALLILEGLRLQGIGGFKGFIGVGYVLPPFIKGAVDIFGVTVDYQRLIIIGAAGLVFLLIWVFTHFTKLGLSLRAIAQDERAALMLGIDSDKTANIALAVGSALAAIAAITVLPLGTIMPEAGYEVLNIAIAVCIIGGLGNWGGVLLAGVVLGFLVTIVTFMGGSTFQSVVLFAAIILTLAIKPSGIFGKQKELEERV